jgi:hypothetical protein
MAWTGAPHVPAGYVDGPQDEETDTYDPTSVAVPFTTPHLYAAMEVTGPAITGFPLHVKALLDIGCPAIMISDNLAKQLGSRRFPLPQEEDNLTSLSQTPLECKEFVKLKVGSGNGAWSSRVFRAKINVGLPVPLILGMPFLSSEHIVIDTQA